MNAHWATLSYEELSRDELYAVMRLRQEVFVVEQNAPYQDADGADKFAAHMLYRVNGELAAYQRLLGPGIKYSETSIGRIVVHPSLRGQDLGRELVRRGVDHNQSVWPGIDICISAQAHLQNFYTSLGFHSEGDIYDEDGIPHCQMRFPATAPR